MVFFDSAIPLYYESLFTLCELCQLAVFSTHFRV